MENNGTMVTEIGFVSLLVAGLGALKPDQDAILGLPDVVAYRAGTAGVVVRAHDDALTVTSTTGCQ